jgi:predicted MFS family arabinose efflux permease
VSYSKTGPASPAAVVVAASIVLAVAVGSRSSWGLFIGPINSASGFGAGAVSLAVAVSALAWGAAQPVCGVLVRHVGAPRLLAAGGVLVAVLTAAIPLSASGAELVVLMAAAGAAGAAAGSAPLLLGIVAQRVTAERRGHALGIVSAGSSVGQLAAAPLLAAAIASFGWQSAMLALALAALLVVPLAPVFRTGARVELASADAPTPVMPIRSALRSRDYWLVTAGFFVCGFHVTFLTTHMPGVIDLCGLPAGFSGLWLAALGACNIASSLVSGHLMQRLPMKSLLATLYALRALGVVAFVALPKSEFVLVGFALWMGLTYMATLPPTTGLIAQLFGARNLATLFGVTTLVHQAGSFLGAWLGGLELELTGGYAFVWWLDVALALGAAAVHLPIREAAHRPLEAAGGGALAPTGSR